MDKTGANTRVTQLIDAAATRRQIMKKLDMLADEADKNSTVVVLLAGIAEPGYFLAFDSDSNKPESAISREELQLAVNGIPAKHKLVIADTCYADTLSTIDPHRGVHFNRTTDEAEGHVFIGASLAKETVPDSPKGLTHVIGDGLRGLADSDGDGVATPHELFLSARQALAIPRSGLVQTPVLRVDGNDRFPVSHARYNRADTLRER